MKQCFKASDRRCRFTMNLKEKKKKKTEQKQTKKKSTSLISVSPNADEGQ